MKKILLIVLILALAISTCPYALAAMSIDDVIADIESSSGKNVSVTARYDERTNTFMASVIYPSISSAQFFALSDDSRTKTETALTNLYLRMMGLLIGVGSDACPILTATTNDGVPIYAQANYTDILWMFGNE